VVTRLDAEYAESGVFFRSGGECAIGRGRAEIIADRAAILGETRYGPTTNDTVGGHKLSFSNQNPCSEKPEVTLWLPMKAKVFIYQALGGH
jgi:hypothetical protein